MSLPDSSCPFIIVGLFTIRTPVGVHPVVRLDCGSTPQRDPTHVLCEEYCFRIDGCQISNRNFFEKVFRGLATFHRFTGFQA